MKKQKRERKVLAVPIYFAVYATVVAACIALDQITKYLIDQATFVGYDTYGNVQRKTISIIGNWLTFYWTTNDGATGGIFTNLSWSNWLFFVMTLVGLPAFGWLLWRSRTRSVWGQVAFAFVIGGTVGNAIDRLTLSTDGKFFGGAVRDFIRVDGFFGIFNVADSFLVVGVILALLAIVFFDYDSLLATFLKDRKAKQEQGADGDVAEATQQTENIEGNVEVNKEAEEVQTSEKIDENNRTDV